jgi:hypothetical protein
LTPKERELQNQRDQEQKVSTIEKVSRQLHLTPNHEGNALGLEGFGFTRSASGRSAHRKDKERDGSRPPRPSVDSGIAEVQRPRRSGESEKLQVPRSPPFYATPPHSARSDGSDSPFYTPRASATPDGPRPSTSTETDAVHAPRPSGETLGHWHAPRPSEDTATTAVHGVRRLSRKLQKRRRVSTRSEAEIAVSKDTPDAHATVRRAGERTDVLEV